METLIYQNSEKKREANWRKVMIAQGLFSKEDKEILNYDDGLWLGQAFANFDRKTFHNRVVKGAVLADGFENSHWYAFYKAVKWYKEKFFKYCAKHGLEIPR